MYNQLTWDLRFLDLAKRISTWSKDPSVKVGAVLVKNKRIIGTGYNGFAAGEDDSPERYENHDEKHNKIHAERNAINYSIQDPKDSILYTTLHPCLNCADLIIEKKILEVVYIDDDNLKYILEFLRVRQMFEERGIILRRVEDNTN